MKKNSENQTRLEKIDINIWKDRSKKIFDFARIKGFKEFYCLVSGGKDSVTTLHLSNEILKKKLKGIVYCDVGCIKSIRTMYFVKELAKQYRLPFTILHPTKPYHKFSKDYDFPKSGMHNEIKNELKHKPIRGMSIRHGKKICFLSGTRKLESKRRFNTAKPYSYFDSVHYLAPLVDWHTDIVFEYLKLNKLKISPVYKELHLSGDCFCGAYGDDGEKKLLEMFEPRVAREIKEMEEYISKQRGYKCHWGNKKTPKNTKDQQELSYACADCGS